MALDEQMLLNPASLFSPAPADVFLASECASNSWTLLNQIDATQWRMLSVQRMLREHALLAMKVWPASGLNLPNVAKD